jgi:hypothetical protein
MTPLNPEHMAEQAGRTEAVATLAAMQQALALHAQGKGSHPAQLLTALLCLVADHEGTHPERFIAGVSVILCPYLLHGLKEAGGSV